MIESILVTYMVSVISQSCNHMYACGCSSDEYGLHCSIEGCIYDAPYLYYNWQSISCAVPDLSFSSYIEITTDPCCSVNSPSTYFDVRDCCQTNDPTVQAVQPTHGPTHRPTDNPTQAQWNECSGSDQRCHTNGVYLECDYGYTTACSLPLTTHCGLFCVLLTPQPTKNPTPAPTSNPTQSPTTPPTPSPTHQPTIPPTPSPTPAPTAAPSVSPTYHPSFAPTTPPTYPPTIAPTHSPTTAPSHAPSFAPTITPSESPTACPDDEGGIISNDGVGRVQKDIVFNVSRYLVSMNDIHTNTIENYTNIGFKEEMECTGNADECHIKCIQDKACPYSSVIARNIQLSVLAINCIGKQACYALEISIFESIIDRINIKCYGLQSCYQVSMLFDGISTELVLLHCVGTDSCRQLKISALATNDNTYNYINALSVVCEGDNGIINGCAEMEYIADTNIANMTFLCVDRYSCNSTSIKTRTRNNGAFSLYCLASHSCQTMNIELYMTNITEIRYQVAIMCADDFSCDDMVMHSDDSIEMDIIMYKYSDNVHITHGRPDRVQLECGNPRDRRFIRYDTDWIKLEDDVVELARSEYDIHHLPCEGIEFDCTQNKYFSQSCQMLYKLNELNISKFLLSAKKTDITCYWLDIYAILDPKCSGTCNQNITLYQHNSSVELNLYLNISNHSVAELGTICDEYFGSPNVTSHTLSDIDGIFEFILEVKYDPFEIYDVVKGPFTELRHGFSALNCSKSLNIVQLVTSFTILSGIKSETEFNAIFLNDNEFIQQSQILLSHLFGVNVIVENQVITAVEKIVRGLETWQDVLIGVAAVVAVLFMVHLLHKCWRKSKAMEIKNPLVISICIGIYDQDIPDLNGIDADVKSCIDLFQNTMNYTMCPKYKENAIRQYWSKTDVMDLLEQESKFLAKNIDVFDSLLVVISSHGSDGCIVCSDGEKIPTHNIHRLFSAANEQNVLTRNMPRLYLFDCCHGEQERDYNTRKEINIYKRLKRDEYESVEINKADTVGIDEQFERIRCESMVVPKQMSDVWAKGEHNPDHKLVVINATNTGFQSKMRSDTGSYFIQQFIEKIYSNDQIGWFALCKNKLYLSDILTNIQNDLEKKGKQLPKYTCFNGTDKIVFSRNSIANNNIVQLRTDIEEKEKLLEVEIENKAQCVSEVELGKHKVRRVDTVDHYLQKIGDIIMAQPQSMENEKGDTQKCYGEVLHDLGVGTSMSDVKRQKSKVDDDSDHTDMDIGELEESTLVNLHAVN